MMRESTILTCDHISRPVDATRADSDVDGVCIHPDPMPLSKALGFFPPIAVISRHRGPAQPWISGYLWQKRDIVSGWCRRAESVDS